jgi:protein-S-isoprenylcysteine O-methyltransferase Ste14
VNQPDSNVEAAFAQGPVKATRKAHIPDGKRREKRLERLRLQGFYPIYAAACFLALTAPLAEPHPAWIALRFIGLGLMVLGLLMRIWSFGYLLKREELATAGPYGRTRNPLYVGTWLIGCGLMLNAAAPYNLALLAAYNVLFYFIYRAQIGIEEEMLRDIFKAAFDEYCRNVPRFFPRVSAWKVGDVSTFSLGRALKNKTLQPIAGLLLLLALQMTSWGLLWPMLRGASFEAAWQAFMAGGWIGLK